jgi:hypothetical protein
MEIQALTLLITEQDLNELLGRYLPADSGLENVQIRIAPEGVHVTGEYPVLVRVGFETLWELEARTGKVHARLVGLKAMGLPAAVFKGAVLKAIEEAVQSEAWLAFDNDTMVVDVDRLLAERGIQAKTNLNAVRCRAQEVIIESTASH